MISILLMKVLIAEYILLALVALIERYGWLAFYWMCAAGLTFALTRMVPHVG